MTVFCVSHRATEAHAHGSRYTPLWVFEWCPVCDKIGHLCRARHKGTLFALVTGSNAVAQFDDEFNVKSRANRLMNWLARPDQQRVLRGVSFRAAENSLEQTSTKLSLNRRRPIRIADAGSGKV